MKKPLIGFIGQGWIGKNYSNDLENRGYTVVRYGLEPEFAANKKKIATCDIVFIAVPTPTSGQKFDDSILRSVLPLVGKGKIAVIKSTIIVGTTTILQKAFPDIKILHSPEFLSEKTAAEEAANPEQNIIGVPEKTKKYLDAANLVMSVLPKARLSLICTSSEAELIKYSHNVHGYIQVVFANLMYDLAEKFSMDWGVLFKAFSADRYMVPRYLKPVHQSGRGAGGNCFIKDFEAFLQMFKEHIPDEAGIKVLESIRDKNLKLLLGSNKDLEKIIAVYGDRFTDSVKKTVKKLPAKSKRTVRK